MFYLQIILYFFRFQVFAALESFHTSIFFCFDPTLGTQFFSIFFLSTQWNDFLWGGGSEEHQGKNEKKKENGQKKIQSRARTEKKSKWDLMHHLFSFSGEKSKSKGSIWRQRDLIKPSGICIRLLGFTTITF